MAIYKENFLFRLLLEILLLYSNMYYKSDRRTIRTNSLFHIIGLLGSLVQTNSPPGLN